MVGDRHFAHEAPFLASLAPQDRGPFGDEKGTDPALLQPGGGRFRIGDHEPELMDVRQLVLVPEFAGQAVNSLPKITGIQQVVFAALLALLAGAIEPTLSGSALVLAGVVLALVPAALWLAFFYAQDRLEPELKGYVRAFLF